jgi:hypothetical protein
MKVACHQPVYLPWPGFFCKALKADILVLLDQVQFPRGTSYVNRNRVKTPSGQAWLTVPVRKKGRGLQLIRNVEIYNERGWAEKHMGTLIHAYKRSPFLDDHVEFLEGVYGREWDSLVDLNLTFLRHLLKVLGIDSELKLLSETGIESTGTSLLVDVCKSLGSETYATISTSRAHLEEELFRRNGITLEYYNYRCPGYPQLWGEFIPNLSIVDLILNCGPKARAYLERSMA